MKKSPGHEGGSVLGKLLYGTLFCVIIPAYLLFWESRLGHLTLPKVPDVPIIGAAIGLAGALLMVSGIHALWVHGRGLPMNAFPPEIYVRQGIYRWFNEPIYLGFAFSSFGLSLTFQSGAGLWVISPFVVLATAALIHGYERPDLLRRFG